MIFGAWGLSLNIMTIAVLCFCVSLLLISLVVTVSNDVSTRFEAQNRIRLLWCYVTLPWLVSISSVALLIFPELFQLPKTWLTPFVHWDHVFAFPIYSWHGASLILFSAIFLFLFLSKLIKALKTNAHINQLNYFVTKNQLPDGCILIDSEIPQAFTSGLFRPRSYITTGLRNRLSQQESDIVQQHELAHVQKVDPLRKYVFALFTSFFPGVSEKYLNETFALSLEQLADDTVLKSINDDTLISKTIIKVARLSNESTRTDYAPPSLCHFALHPLELRIQYLLSDNKGKPFPFILLIVLAALTITISTLSVDLLHHGFEHLFNH